MALADIARRFEDGWNRRGIVRSRARGWVPTTIPFTGYGSVSSVRVLGRVIMTDPSDTQDFQPDDDDFERYRGIPLNPRALALEAERGFKQFFTIQVGFIPVTVRAGDKEVQVKTDRSGYVDVRIADHGLPPGWHEVTIEAKAAQPVTARVLIVDPDVRTGIISDIDDTVVITMLPRIFLAAYNSWVRHPSSRRPVPQMAEFYRRLVEEHPHTPVFYISTGAWNTMPTLELFLAKHGFPTGPLLMTDWGPTPVGLFRSGIEHKRTTLRNLIIAYPQIRWLLVGDDGQHDPYIYKDLAIEHPSHVEAIAIRELTPTEQVLSHGTPEQLERNHDRLLHGTAMVRGADGTSLAARLAAWLWRKR